MKDQLNCKIADKCGGCRYAGIPYEDSLKEKEARVRELLGKFHGIEPIVGMKDPFHYRNKVHHVYYRKKDGTDRYGI